MVGQTSTSTSSGSASSQPAQEKIEDAAVTPSETSAPKTVDTKKDRITKFKTLSAKDIEKFGEIAGPQNVVTDLEEINPFVRDFTNKYIGVGSVVITPSTTE